jgi:hypothetical protein
MVYGVHRPRLISLALLGETGILVLLIAMRAAALKAAVGL